MQVEFETIIEAELVFDVKATTYESGDEIFYRKIHDVTVDYLDLGGVSLTRRQLVALTSIKTVIDWETIRYEQLVESMG